MSGFNNRMTAQRELLKVVNSQRWPKEDLLSLSSKAIERWIMANGVDPNCRLALLVWEASEKLFFLASKSQEQMTAEYRTLSGQFEALLRATKEEMRAYAAE